MSALTSPKTYVALAVFHAVDAVLCAIPIPQLDELLDTLRVPQRTGPVQMGWVLAGVKTFATVGLLSVFRFPGLARLTTAMLTLYFAIAVGLHIRTRDRASDMTRAAGLLAAFFLATCAAMSVVGPEQRRPR